MLCPENELVGSTRIWLLTFIAEIAGGMISPVAGHLLSAESRNCQWPVGRRGAKEGKNSPVTDTNSRRMPAGGTDEQDHPDDDDHRNNLQCLRRR